MIPEGESGSRDGKCVDRIVDIVVERQRTHLASNLLLVDFKSVTIRHIQLEKGKRVSHMYSYCEFRIRHEGPNRTYSVRRVLRSHSGAVKKETDGGGLLSLPFTEGIHEFLQLSRPLDLEENLIVVISDLDVEVLDSASWGLASLWCIGHGCGVSCECGGEKRILAWEESVTFR